MRKPAVAATANALQVHGNISAATWLKGRSLLLSPISRRSTVMIEPTTKTNANTWIVSIVGNSHSDSRICVGKFKTCSQAKARSMEVRSDIGYPAARDHDASADRHAKPSERLPRASSRGRIAPIVGTAAHAQLRGSQDSRE